MIDEPSPRAEAFPMRKLHEKSRKFARIRDREKHEDDVKETYRTMMLAIRFLVRMQNARIDHSQIIKRSARSRKEFISGLHWQWVNFTGFSIAINSGIVTQYSLSAVSIGENALYTLELRDFFANRLANNDTSLRRNWYTSRREFFSLEFILIIMVVVGQKSSKIFQSPHCPTITMQNSAK